MTTQYRTSSQDVIGAGRYIISFILAGFVGLGVAYLLRKEGWLAVWLNALIFAALVVLFLQK
jgi:hypothetical protein